MGTFDAPTTLPNLAEWYKSDAGITIAGGKVTGWADQSGNGRNFRMANGAVGALQIASALNGRPVVELGDTTGLAFLPIAQAATLNAFTLFGVWNVTAAGASPDVMSDTTTFRMSPARSPQRLTVASQTIEASSNANNSGNGYYAWCLSMSKVGVEQPTYNGGNYLSYFTADGAVSVCSHATGSWSSSLETYIPYNSVTVRVAEFLRYARALSIPECWGVLRYLASAWGLWSPWTAPRPLGVIAMGNSTTRYSNGIVKPLAVQNPSIPIVGVSVARDGTNATTMMMQRDQVCEMVSYMVRRGVKPTVIIHSGHNGQSYEQPVWSDPEGPNMQARLAGAQVLAQTQSVWNADATRESSRLAWNTTLTANWEDWADWFHPLGSTSKFGAYDNGTPTAGTSRGDDPLNWADEVHPTEAGQQAKAALMQPILKAMAAYVSLTTNAVGSITLAINGVPAGWSIQWIRSTLPFDPRDKTTRGTALSGKTSATCVDTTATPNATYYYCCKLTGPGYEGMGYTPALAVTAKAGNSPFIAA